MNKPLFSLAAAALLALAVPSLASAQAPTRRQAGPDAAARRAFIQEHRGDARKKWEALTPEQREAFKAQMKAYADERKALAEQVKAGTIDRKTAAEKLKAWREAHKPAKP